MQSVLLVGAGGALGALARYGAGIVDAASAVKKAQLGEGGASLGAAAGLTALVLSVALAGPVLAANPDPSTAIEPADTLEGNFLSAYIAGASRDTAAAVTFFREAIKEDPRNPELMERAFVAFLADGATADAFRLAERIVVRDPSNSLAQFTIGVRALRAKQYAAARKALQKGGRGRAADLTATLLTAWSYAGAGDGRKALETADRLKGERAFTQFREYHAGLIADLTKNRAEAERRLKAAYEGDRNTLQIVNAYGRFEARRGNRERRRRRATGPSPRRARATRAWPGRPVP